jgi:hypothetical protein
MPSPDEARAALLAAARALLPDATAPVTVVVASHALVVTDGQPAAPVQQALVNHASVNPLVSMFLSPTCRRIVTYLAAHGPARHAAIAQALGLGDGTTSPAQVRMLLHNLLMRGVLVHTLDGYAVSDALRPVLGTVVRRAERVDPG